MKTGKCKFLTALLICLLSAGCAWGPRFFKIPDGGTILAFGDSLTYGMGEGSPQSYPAQLETVLNMKVINAGVSGEVSSQGVQRLGRVLDETHPSLMILIHGGNDLLRGMDRGTLYANLKSMIESAKSRHVQVLLLDVPEPAIFLRGVELYRKVAEDTETPILKDAIGKILSQGALKDDYVHPNAEGNRILAQNIADFLKKKGAVE